MRWLVLVPLLVACYSTTPPQVSSYPVPDRSFVATSPDSVEVFAEPQPLPARDTLDVAVLEVVVDDGGHGRGEEQTRQLLRAAAAKHGAHAVKITKTRITGFVSLSSTEQVWYVRATAFRWR